MASFYDVMVDLESTGTDPDETGILQIAAVKFNFADKTVGPTFDRCLTLAPKRYWDEGTRHWWSQQKASVLRQILARGEDPATVLNAFADWVRDGQTEPVRFWSKPTHFDFVFLSSYFRQFDVENPFHYRYAVDMNSFLRGWHKSTEVPNVEVPFAGDAHNALFDCLHQIKTVFVACQ